MRSLYEIDRQIENAINLGFDSETGEILGFKELEALKVEKTEKIEGIGLWIKNLLAEADMVKSEKMKLALRQTQLEKKAEALKQYLADHMDESEKIKTGNLSIGWRSSEAVDVINEAIIPDAYIRIKSEVDKAELKKALKLGIEVPGAQLLKKQNLQIK